MKIGKLRFLLLLPSLLILLLAACHSGSKPELQGTSIQAPSTDASSSLSPEFPAIPKDYYYLSGEQVYYSYSAAERGRVYFTFISASPLTEEEIAIEIAGKRIPEGDYLFMQYGIEEQFELSLPMYQTFRGKDWKKECQFQLAYKGAEKDYGKRDLYQDTVDALEVSQKEFLDDYEALKKQNKLPVLYRYVLRITLPEYGFGMESSMKEITIRAMGTEKTFPVGEIRYTEEEDRSAFPLDTLVPSRFSGGWIIASSVNPDQPAVVDDRGNILLHNLGSSHLRALEDLTITSIELWADTRQMSEIHPIISLPSEGGTTYDENGKEIHNIIADYIWDGASPIFLEEGQELSVDAVLYDPRLANAAWGFTEFKIATYYENSAGEKGLVLQEFPILIQTEKADPFEIYLQNELGINAMSYYTDYYNVLNTEGYGGETVIIPMPSE